VAEEFAPQLSVALVMVTPEPAISWASCRAMLFVVTVSCARMQAKDKQKVINKQ
jgi:hypothetical protein